MINMLSGDASNLVGFLEKEDLIQIVLDIIKERIEVLGSRIKNKELQCTFRHGKVSLDKEDEETIEYLRE